MKPLFSRKRKKMLKDKPNKLKSKKREWKNKRDLTNKKNMKLFLKV